MHEKVIQFDGQSLLYVECIARIVKAKVEVLQQHSSRENSFLPSESSSNTTTYTVAKWFPCFLWKF
jgi:hypothetical protein